MRYLGLLFLLLASPAFAIAPEVTKIVIEEAERAGLDPAFALAVVDIESSGNCSANSSNSATKYKGLLQLSGEEFSRLGGRDIYNCRDNARIGLAKIAKEADTFREANDRDATALELYLIHQQGPEGQAAHANNLDLPAWKSVWLHTSEGVSKGQGWSQLAVWGNVPSDVRPPYRGVENVTSRNFIDIWSGKLERRMVALAPPPPPEPEIPAEEYTCYVAPHMLQKLRRVR